MILKNELYGIEGQHPHGETVTYDISLRAGHFIYQAHFPGEPITPGVCVIQIAKELLEDYLQRPLAIRSIKQVKFLAVISPRQHPQVRYTFGPLQASPLGLKTVVDVTAGDTHMAHISFTCQP